MASETIAQATRGRPKTFPVVEIFGPTIQGEGIDQGVPCHFVRFGGCDFRCDWCDSPHAVLPELVRNSERLTKEGIIGRLARLPRGPRWIVFSGGNPCLHDLESLIGTLKMADYKVALETQGTRIKSWVPLCDRVAVSPKPPSSGMKTNWTQLERFLRMCSPKWTFLKVVVFDIHDWNFARELHHAFPGYQFLISAGNDAGPTVGSPDRKDDRTEQQVAFDLITKGRRIANWLMADHTMSDVRIQMQQHVLYWGNERGR